jgi:ParB/RepB/Spo0J family partition protein
MLSNEFQAYDVDLIYVEKEERQRKEIKDIESLAHSISVNGLINPIIIHRDGKLRAGERRLTAVKTLGWSHVTVQFVESMGEAELQRLELAENVERASLTWQEECDAIAKYHELSKQLEPDWTATKTAEALGISVGSVSSKLDVAQALASGAPAVAAAEKFSVARGIVVRAKERQQNATIADIFPAIAEQKAARIAPIYNADFLTWAKTDPGVRFNFIHCDFPYGVNADKHDQGAADGMGGYADSFDVYNSLLEGLAVFTSSGYVSEQAHLLFWFSMDYYQLTLERLTDMGWKVNPFPLIWHKSDNVGILPDPSRGPRRIYETAFMASRGDRKIVRAVSNVVSAPTTKEIHMSEKSIVMLKKFMEMFVDESTIGLDPTCGSGNAVRAMAHMGAAHCIGLELDPNFAALAKENFYGDE